MKVQNQDIIYIIYDDEVVSAPAVQTEITDGQCVVQGMASYEEAESLSIPMIQTTAPISRGSSGAPLPELLRRVLNEQHMPCPEIEDGESCSWQRTLSHLCRQMADDLPGGAAERLLTMPTRFSETDETQPLLAQLDAAIGDMHARRQELEQQLAQLKQLKRRQSSTLSLQRVQADL